MNGQEMCACQHMSMSHTGGMLGACVADGCQCKNFGLSLRCGCGAPRVHQSDFCGLCKERAVKAGECFTVAGIYEVHNIMKETQKSSNPKEAFGSDKIPLSLWPATATAEGAMAFLHGALKYGRCNWRVAGVRASTYMDAHMRHMQSWWEGEDTDPDSGLSHLSHALACIAVLIDAKAADKLNDDRAYPGGYGKLTRQLTNLVASLKRDAKAKGLDPKHWTRETKA